MGIVYLTTRGCSVRRRGQMLQVWNGDSKMADLHLGEMERLVVLGSIQLTTQALNLLLERGIDVVLMSSGGKLLGTLVSGWSRNVYLRLAQFERWKDDEFRVELSRELAKAKLGAQLRLLDRHARNHPGSLEPEAAELVASCLAKVPETATLDGLRGLEGTAAAAYFRQFGKMLLHVDFPGRKMHPSTDPVNALLSLGYVMLTNEIITRLDARGFDPAIAFFHGLRYGRQSLALDLVEPFRQPVIDRLTLRLFNRRQVQAADFEGSDKGLRLGADRFSEYLQCYEEQLRSPCEGKGSETWRDRVSRQIEELREMVLSREARPFIPWEG